jgi:hypothetical protein
LQVGQLKFMGFVPHGWFAAGESDLSDFDLTAWNVSDVTSSAGFAIV